MTPVIRWCAVGPCARRVGRQAVEPGACAETGSGPLSALGRCAAGGIRHACGPGAGTWPWAAHKPGSGPVTVATHGGGRPPPGHRKPALLRVPAQCRRRSPSILRRCGRFVRPHGPAAGPTDRPPPTARPARGRVQRPPARCRGAAARAPAGRRQLPRAPGATGPPAPAHGRCGTCPGGAAAPGRARSDGRMGGHRSVPADGDAEARQMVGRSGHLCVPVCGQVRALRADPVRRVREMVTGRRRSRVPSHPSGWRARPTARLLGARQRPASGPRTPGAGTRAGIAAPPARA